MEYIDADKLKAEIERLDEEYRTLRVNGTIEQAKAADLVVHVIHGLSNFIRCFQQEQPDFNDVDPKRLVHSHYTKVRETKTGRVFWAEYSIEAAEWYEAGTGKAYSISDVEIVKEQLEMDLEKFTEKIKTFQGRYKHPEIVSIKGAMAFMARMFYQYPNVARQWYDSLPKATMD